MIIQNTFGVNLSSKSEQTEVFMTWVKEFQKDHRTKVKTVGCDNSGENVALQKVVESYKDLHIKFQFTAPYTPQQNCKIERKFATLWGKVRSMLNGAKLPWALGHKL
jgi:hypothetical protein